MEKKLLIILNLIFLSLILISCWDMVEINERILVTSVGIDLNKTGKGKGDYVITYVYPNIYAMGKEPTQKEERFVFSTISNTLFEASRHLATRIDKPFYFKHLKVIVIGEDLLRYPHLLEQILDGLNRDQRVNRKLKIAVAKGSAKEVLEIKPKQEPVTGGYLNDIIENTKRSSRFTPQTLTGLIKESEISGITLVPKIEKKKNELVISGGAILKDYKLVGWIGEEENKLLAIMKDKVKTELIDVPVENILLSYVVTGVRTKRNVLVGRKNIKATFDIYLEGYIQQYTLEKKKNTFEDKFIEKAEKQIDKRVKNDTNKMIEHLQKTYRTDILGIGEYLSKHNPKVWKNIRKNWDEIFPNINIEVNITSKIRRTGLTK